MNYPIGTLYDHAHGSAATRIDDIDQILGFSIRIAHGAVYTHFTNALAGLDLTQKQVAILWLIDEQPEVAQTDIVRKLQIDRATVMAIVNRLQTRGLVERGASEGDRRRRTLHLTLAGHEILAKARACVFDHEAWLKERFSAGEITQLLALLRRIRK